MEALPEHQFAAARFIRINFACRFKFVQNIYVQKLKSYLFRRFNFCSAGDSSASANPTLDKSASYRKRPREEMYAFSNVIFATYHQGKSHFRFKSIWGAREANLYPGESNDGDSEDAEDDEDNNDDEYSDGGTGPLRSKAGRRNGASSVKPKRAAPAKRAQRPKYTSPESQESDSAPHGAFPGMQDQPGVPRVARRENHNSAEKRRRDKINDKLQILRALLPFDGMSGASKAQTLARTVDFLRQLEAAHLDATKHQQQLLQRKQQLLGGGAQISDSINVDRISSSRQTAALGAGGAASSSFSTGQRDKPKRQPRAKRAKKENDDEYVPSEPALAVLSTKLGGAPATRGIHNPAMVTIDTARPGPLQQPKPIPPTSMPQHIFTAHGQYGLTQAQPIFLHNLGHLQQGSMHQDQDPRAMQHPGGPYFIPQEFNYFRPQMDVKADPGNQYGAPDAPHYFNPLPVRGATMPSNMIVTPSMPQIVASVSAAGTAKAPSPPNAASSAADAHLGGSLLAALPPSSLQKGTEQSQSQPRQHSAQQRLPDINEPPGASEDSGATPSGLRIPRPERSPPPTPAPGANIVVPPPLPGPEMSHQGVGPSPSGMNHLHPYPQEFYNVMFSSPLRGPTGVGGPPMPGSFSSADDAMSKAMNFLQVPYGSGDLMSFGAPGSPRSVYFTPGARSPMHLSLFSTPPMPISPNSPNGGHPEVHSSAPGVGQPATTSADANADAAAKSAASQHLASIDSSVNYSTSGPPKPAAGSAFNRTGSAHLTPPGVVRPNTLLHPALYASPTHHIVGLSPPASPMHPGAVQSLYSLYGSLNFPTPPVPLEHADHTGQTPFLPQFFSHLLTPPTHAHQMMEMQPGLPRVVVDEVKSENP
jgi:hypothetical protein